MNKDDKKYLSSLTYTIIVGFLLIIVTMLFSCDSFKMPQDSGGWVYEYQTLLSAAVAFGTGLFFLYQHHDNIKRKGFAAKSQMAEGLSQILEYAKEAYRFIYNDRQDLPSLNEAHIKNLRDLIEFVDPKSAESIFKLITFLQVYQARFRYIETYRNDIDFFNNRIFDTVRLSFLVIRLFEYARDEVASIPYLPPSKNDMLSALRQLIGPFAEMDNRERFNEISGVIAEYYPED